MTQADLAALPVAERIKMMEELWESLSVGQTAASIIPDWHTEVLQQRARMLNEGSDPPTDWSEAKQRIRDQAAAGK